MKAGLNLRIENRLPPLRILYTNADQFLNKRDLLLVHITGNHPPDIIIISEMLSKSPNSVITSALFALPGYFLYTNFDPDNHAAVISCIRGVGIFVSKRLQARQVFFNAPDFEDHVWAENQLRGCDSLLVGCIYRSPTGHLSTSVSSL